MALLTFIVASLHILGCGRGVVLEDEQGGPADWISSRYPATNATITSRNVNLTITFGRDMNTTEGSGVIVTGEGHTAGEPAGEPFALWSDARTFNIFVEGPMSGGVGGVVHLISSTEAFRDSNGNYLPAGTELWRFTDNYDELNSHSISGTVSQISGTDEGTIDILVYDSSNGIAGYTTLESPGAYSVDDVASSGTFYVRAYRNVLGIPLKWHRGYPSYESSGLDLSSDRTVNPQLTAPALTIESRSPSIGSTGVAADRTIWITFNNAIRNFADISFDAFAVGPSHEAGTPTVQPPPLTISDDLRTVRITTESWDGDGPWVDIETSSLNRFMDMNAQTLPDGMTLWKYELATYSISGTVSDGPETMEVFVIISTVEVPTADQVLATAEGTGPSVSYNFTGLMAGSYYVIAWRDADGGGIETGPAGTGVTGGGAHRCGRGEGVAAFTAHPGHAVAVDQDHLPGLEHGLAGGGPAIAIAVVGDPGVPGEHHRGEFGEVGA